MKFVRSRYNGKFWYGVVLDTLTGKNLGFRWFFC